MKPYFALLFFAINIVAFAQPKEYNKLKNLLDTKQYAKCIKMSKKFISKNPHELMPLFYCSKANFELFKKDSASSNLKQSLKYIWKISKADKKQENTEVYKNLKQELKATSKEYAENLFYQNKNTSKVYYDYIAKIYQDTLDKYYEFYPELRKSIIQDAGINTKQISVNQVDKNGKKQGFWTKKYKSGVVAYEVYFKDDKPVGTHKRYHPNGKLMATLVFDENGEWSDSELFDDNASLIAKGRYQNKQKQGLWTLYKDTAVVGKENYKNNKKHGISQTFYANNGRVSEEKHWENGVENGVWRQYYHNGKKRLETKVENGKRNGIYLKYHTNGVVETKGAFKNDIMEGEWIYYDRYGEQLNVINYKNGKADKQEEMDKKQIEILKKLEANKGRFVDPAKYINNPQEYFNKTR